MTSGRRAHARGARLRDAYATASSRLRVRQRGKARAAQLEPALEFALVRLEVGRTALVRDLVAGSDLHVMPAIDTAELTEAAALGRTLAPERTCAPSAMRSAAAAAACNALREVKHEALAAITRALHAICAICSVRSPMRSTSAARCSIAPRRRSGGFAAVWRRRRTTRAIASARSYARTSTRARFRTTSSRFARAASSCRSKRSSAGEFPGIVHDTSGSGQTLFIEPLAALDDNNRVRTLRLEEEREVQRVLEELSRGVGSAADAIERNIEMLAQIDLLVAKANVARAMDAIEPELVDDADRARRSRPPSALGRTRRSADDSARSTARDCS